MVWQNPKVQHIRIGQQNGSILADGRPQGSWCISIINRWQRAGMGRILFREVSAKIIQRIQLVVSQRFGRIKE